MWAVCSQPFSNHILLRNFNPHLPFKSLLFQIQVKMTSSGGDRSQDPASNPNVSKLQELLDRSSADGWEKSWEQRLTPWDLGRPTPVILHLLQTGALPKGRALVPGCAGPKFDTHPSFVGAWTNHSNLVDGYDVVAIASPERYAVGLDISNNAIKTAREISSSSPNADYFTFLKEDFFTWHPRELFDLIFDYTFFCAIEPGLRPAWTCRIRDLLKPAGELITLMFPISDHKGGPPYKVSLADYEEVLHPMGFEAISVIDNELAVEQRKGREKLGRWKRSLEQSRM